MLLQETLQIFSPEPLKFVIKNLNYLPESLEFAINFVNYLSKQSAYD